MRNKNEAQMVVVIERFLHRIAHMSEDSSCICAIGRLLGRFKALEMRRSLHPIGTRSKRADYDARKSIANKSVEVTTKCRGSVLGIHRTSIVSIVIVNLINITI